MSDEFSETLQFSSQSDSLVVNHIKYVSWCLKNLSPNDWSWHRENSGFVITFHNPEDYMMFMMVWG